MTASQLTGTYSVAAFIEHGEKLLEMVNCGLNHHARQIRELMRNVESRLGFADTQAQSRHLNRAFEILNVFDAEHGIA